MGCQKKSETKVRSEILLLQTTTNQAVVSMAGEKKLKEMGEKEEDKTAKGKKAENDMDEKPKKKKSAIKYKKSGESSKKKVAAKMSAAKEIQEEEKPMKSSALKKSSKEKKPVEKNSKEKKPNEKKPSGEKKGRKVVPGWGLTRGVHPPRFNPFLIFLPPFSVLKKLP